MSDEVHPMSHTGEAKIPKKQKAEVDFSFRRVGFFGALSVFFVVLGVVALCAITRAVDVVKIIDAIQN